MMSSIIAKRLVFHIGGYDASMPPEAVHRRFVRELRRFEGTWSAKASVSEPKLSDDQVAWRVIATGPNWRVETDYRFVRWDDIINADAARPMWRRVALGILAFFDFVVAGALWGYLRTNWRYALFFLYPFLVLAAFIAIAWFFGDLAARASRSLLIGAAASSLALIALLHWPLRWMYLPELLDDWIFSSEYIRHTDPVLEPRLDRIAHQIHTATRRSDTDEVLVVGHSLGAVLAVDLLDRVLKLDAARGLKDSRLAFASVGSSILKIALHWGAKRFRAALKRVGSARAIYWAEYQALVDVMNFCKTDALAEIGLKGIGRPVVRIVRIRDMVSPDFYRRIRGNFYRVHAQFISGNDRRSFYDYFMMVCGPLALEALVTLPKGAGSAIDEHGILAREQRPLESPAQPTKDESEPAAI